MPSRNTALGSTLHTGPQKQRTYLLFIFIFTSNGIVFYILSNSVKPKELRVLLFTTLLSPPAINSSDLFYEFDGLV